MAPFKKNEPVVIKKDDEPMLNWTGAMSRCLKREGMELSS